MDRKSLISLMSVFVELLEGIDDSTYEKLLKGDLSLELAPRRRVPRAKEEAKPVPVVEAPSPVTAKARVAEPPEGDYDALLEELRQAENRDSAKKTLQNHPATRLKKGLLGLAEKLRIGVRKNDRKDLIEDKIVEFVVGVPLRSKAIKDLKLRSSEESQ